VELPFSFTSNSISMGPSDNTPMPDYTAGVLMDCAYSHTNGVEPVVELTHAWTERWRLITPHPDRKLSFATAGVWLANARILFTKLA